ncbi:MAG: ATP-binding protein, partial [Actinomycetota bacterium]|nr:ATP-binding protein [Actinomycetota bacterium]
MSRSEGVGAKRTRRPVELEFVVNGIFCPTLVGRVHEFGEISNALDSAQRSLRGSAVFLIGEAGVGKSRLAQEAIAEARRLRFSVLYGRAAEADIPLAFRPFAEALCSYFRESGPLDLPELKPFQPILARLVPEWRGAASAPAGESIVLLAEALLRVLRAVGRRAGCLLVLEDLHWADPETLSIIEYLAENLASEPVVCLCTVRSGEGSGATGL